jgi:hypothetical protein
MHPKCQLLGTQSCTKHSLVREMESISKSHTVVQWTHSTHIDPAPGAVGDVSVRLLIEHYA